MGATFKYFSGERELSNITYISGKPYGLPAGEEMVFVAGEGWTGRVIAERVVEFKANPSRHECDARCMNATGRVMKCECACGGKNHGRAAFSCEAA